MILGTIADLEHLVAGLRLERADQLLVDVGEDDLVSALVQELGDEAASDVACAEVHRCLHALILGHEAILSAPAVT